MLVSELKKLTPALEVAALDMQAQYLVTVPSGCTEQTIEIIQHTLNQAGLACLVVPEDLKFFHLSPEVPLTPKWVILYYDFDSNHGTCVNDAGPFETEDDANSWISGRGKLHGGYYEARPEKTF